jgi:hypothetical protein
MKIRNGFVSNSSSASFVIDKDHYGGIKDLAQKMIWIRDFGNNEELVKKLDSKELPAGTGISFDTCEYRTYISETKNFFIVQTSRNHGFEHELDGIMNSIPEEVSEDVSEHGYLSRDHKDKESMLEGIEKHYAYWFAEYDLVGRGTDDDACCCDKHDEDKIKLQDGTAVCPLCHAGGLPHEIDSLEDEKED